MSATQNQRVALYRGEDVTLVFLPGGTADVTGWTVEFAVDTTAGQSVLTVAATLTDAQAGEFAVDITRAQTAALTAGNYLWDVWRTNPGSSRRLGGGTLDVFTPVRDPS